jgi:hypothetical protein
MTKCINAAPHELRPQQMTFEAFCREAYLKPLENHGRAAEVFFRGSSLGFVDHLGIAGLMQAHERELNNALYSHSPTGLPIDDELPSAAALAEYPHLRQRFPEAVQLVDAQNASVQDGIVSASPDAHGNVLRSASAEQLLMELAHRGVLMDLHHAVGGLHDHLERAGYLDSENPLTSYLIYRLRAADAAVSGRSDSADVAGGWREKIDILSAAQVRTRH